jgi:lon-related putative ATP-dependent protease
MSDYQLAADQLSYNCDLGEYGIATTAELEGAFRLGGQDRALAALDFGLQINQAGYNIYALNFRADDELEYILQEIKDVASGEEQAADLCYVYNFSDGDQPLALEFPAGTGSQFKEKLETIVEEIKEAIDNLFSSERYNKQQRRIKNEYQSKTNELLNGVKEEVKEKGYLLTKEEERLSLTPLSDNEEPMSEKKYNSLPLEEQKQIDQNVREIEQEIGGIFDQLDKLEEEYEAEIEDLDNRLVQDLVEQKMEGLYHQFSKLAKVIGYLDDLKEDLLNNIGQFKDEQEARGIFVVADEENKKPLDKYKVNLVVDNSHLEGAPVVKETNPTYYNLLGRVEYRKTKSGLETDFNQIRAGALQEANGGYLVLEVEKLLKNFKAWQLLKQVLSSEEIKMENLGVEYEQIPISTLEPEAIATDLKVILVGSPQLYYLLQSYDDKFEKLFKIKADFSTTVERSADNVYKLVQFISYKCSQEELLELDINAVEKVIEYAARSARNQDKLVANYNLITDLLKEANLIARNNEQELITTSDLEEVIGNREYWSGKYETKLHDLYETNKLLINTTGEQVGVVNGLSIVDLGDFSYGRPTKITAAVYKGDDGIINIEREANISGEIHDKGVMILESYLGEHFAQQVALNLSARICFEQIYTEIDGDSASSAELYGLLSALAEIPLKQGIAVTGSINQKGQIQPVGGVTDKIEGFFKLCQTRGLTGEQGVIIPKQNKDDLMLQDEVIKAVQEQQFSIYAISNVEQGLEILSEDADAVEDLAQQKINSWSKLKNG